MLLSELQTYNEFSLLLIISSNIILCLYYISVQYSEGQACITASNDVGIIVFGQEELKVRHFRIVTKILLCVIVLRFLVSSQIIIVIVY